jgi:hypothetical protein
MFENPFAQQKGPEAELTAPARIAFSQYPYMCHNGVTMSTFIFLYGYFYALREPWPGLIPIKAGQA